MPTPTLSYQELEALHDVIEAARCFWHLRSDDRDRAARVLRLVNALYWRLGEELPKTGAPSERFSPVMHSSSGTHVEQILEFALNLTHTYAKNNDPWWADTI